MWKRMIVVAGGISLAIALPVVALAATTPDPYGSDVPTPTVADEAPYEDDVVYVAPTTTLQIQEQTQQRLRVHVETGPPEGFEPIQQRLHTQDRTGTCTGECTNPDGPLGTGPYGPASSDDATQRRGNPDAPMLGDGSGECINPDGPIGTGPHGPGGGQGNG